MSPKHKPETVPKSLLEFEPVMGNSPAVEIAAQIRERISSQLLKIGDRLPSERALESQFQVSRNSIRQALKSLAHMGLLEIRKGQAGGAFVKGGGSDAINVAVSDLFHLSTISPSDLTEVRVIIGVEVARLACLRATEEEIDDLEANVVAAEQAVRQGNTKLRTELNLEFHRKLARMTRNPLLATLTATVINLTHEFGKDMVPMTDRSVMPLRRHLLAHLRARDAVAAAAEMHTHLLRLQRYYLKQAGQTRNSRNDD